MRVVALISGGKDSSFNMLQCVAAGHEIVALANLTPHIQTEIDSYMYQSVGHEAIDFVAKAMNLPLFKQVTRGETRQRGKCYQPIDDNDEVEDLFKLLKRVQDNIEIDAVSVGAILSDYQRIRVENVCVRLGLTPLAYLWQRNQSELLNEMIKCEVDAIIIKVAALGLDPSKHLGRSLSSIQSHLHAMHEKYGLNVCGEGGEYETLTLDCPLFKNRIVINESEIVLHTNDTIAPVGYLKLNRLSLVNKVPDLDLSGRLNGLPLKSIADYVSDCLEESELDSSNLQRTETSNPKQTGNANQNTDGWLWIGGIQSNALQPDLMMKLALNQLKLILLEENYKITDVCSLTLFIADMSQYNELNGVYCEVFNYPNPPCRACVEVPLDRNCLILNALAWKQQNLNDSGDLPIERHTMHVQSRSHWAPANIGPYSQAIHIGEFIYLAGQIGMVPADLQLIQNNIRAQCKLTLRHISRLLKAIDDKVDLRDVVQGICYVTDMRFIEDARDLWEENSNNAIVEYVVVNKLPKNALVEWQVWAHRHNSQFEYEETGICVDNYSISIYRRWNYENNIAAIVCHVENSVDLKMTSEIFTEAVDFTVRKLQQGHENDENLLFELKIFYSVWKIACFSFEEYLNELRKTINLVYTLVPVVYLKNEHTYFSICGVRSQ